MAESTLAKLAKAAMENGKDLALLIDAAGVVVAAASALLKEAEPVAGKLDAEAIAEKLKSGADAMAHGAGKAGAAAGAVVESALSKLGDVRDGILSDLADAKSEKELRKAIKEARQSVLENATNHLAVSDLVKSAGKGPAAIGPISDMPGCFVIATYRRLDFDSDLTDYTGVYVGRSANASEGVMSAISREGDPDVYADVKFKQNVHVYVYNCLAEDLDERYSGLLQTFAGDGLYGEA